MKNKETMMNATIIRYALTLVFCTFAFGGWAQDGDVIFKENFDGLTNATLVQSRTNWSSLLYCYGAINVSTPNTALKIQRLRQGQNGPEGHATTTALAHSGDYFLSFSHAYTSGSTATKARVILSNGAYFKENNLETIDIDVKTKFDKKYTTTTLRMINVTSATTITFESTSDIYYAIDDVIVTKIPIITINEGGTNSDVLEANTTKTVNTYRTLLGGIWNTMCLPFDVTMADLVLALGTGQDIQLRTFNSYGDGVLHFSIVDNVTAGTPFLIKLNNTVENPTFHGVTISSTTASSVEDNGVSFVGTYSPVNLEADDTNVKAFLTRDNTLALPTNEGTLMNGLRAYFVIPKNLSPSAARLAIDDETTAVSGVAVTAQRQTARSYDLSGRHVEHPRHGLYVVDGRLTFLK